MARMAQRTGRMSDSFRDAPDIQPGLLLYWQAYSDLSTCRPPSFGDPAFIPWTAVDQYAQRFRFSDVQVERLHYLVREMDLELQDWWKVTHGNGDQSKPARTRRKTRVRG